MAFSESWNIGDVTFANLENQVKLAANAVTNSSYEVDGAVDVVNDSQEEILANTPHHRRTSKLKTSKRKQFRKTKSDSVLKVSTISPGQLNDNNYSELFHSEFLPHDFEQRNTKEHCEDKENFHRFVVNGESKVASPLILKSLPQEETATPIIMDSIKEIESPEEYSCKNSNVLNFALIGSENLKDDEIDNVMNIDETSFVIEPTSKEGQLMFVREMELGKREVEKEMSGYEDGLRSKSKINETFALYYENAKNSSSSKVNNTSKVQRPPNCNIEELKNLMAWSLPLPILKSYEKKGLTKMFDWQAECLSNAKVLFEHSNLVYSAPTSAGKTLVSEILILKTVIERHKKAIMILPFVSVVREKMIYLQELLTPAGYRAEGFFGGYNPPGGFDSVHVAICTIEKANSIVNRLMEQCKLDDIGIIVIDEIHLISDPSRGYILELLLAKVLYISRKCGLQIQIVTMSATLSNVELLKQWLDGELYVTRFRPVALQEMIKIGHQIYDCNMKMLRNVHEKASDIFRTLEKDTDNVAQLCIETLLEGCSVIVFCPSKDWCEKLATQLASAILTLGKSGTEAGNRLRTHIDRSAINDVKKRLMDTPTGLDSVLGRTITLACAFHHAGLTMEEREIVEGSFKAGILKVIVATSTLSSGVNLPARRVIIRTPLFGGKPMNSLTYKQMIGRAGRTGQDTLGESILVCTEANGRIGRELVTSELKPIVSCLQIECSSHLKRALLEVIASGVATTEQDIENFMRCTLLCTAKDIQCARETTDDDKHVDYLEQSLLFLIEYEFIRCQKDEDTKEKTYVATPLGCACLASSMPPTDGLMLFSELQRSRRCFVLESELHAVYLVTPYSVCAQLPDLDWLSYLHLWEQLGSAMQRVGELVGVQESFLVRAMRGQGQLDYKSVQTHKRFYCALALQELVNETPIGDVSRKYKCTRGILQSLQQTASTFAGIVTAFCTSLRWNTLSVIVGQFRERLFFGVQHDLVDLMRLTDLNQKRARALYDAKIACLVDLANADEILVEKILQGAYSFATVKQLDHENEYEANRRNMERNLFITGKAGVSISEAARMLVQEARKFVQHEIGVKNINWSQPQRLNETKETVKVEDEFEKGRDLSREKLTVMKSSKAECNKKMKEEKEMPKKMMTRSDDQHPRSDECSSSNVRQARANNKDSSRGLHHGAEKKQAVGSQEELKDSMMNALESNDATAAGGVVPTKRGEQTEKMKSKENSSAGKEKKTMRTSEIILQSKIQIKSPNEITNEKNIQRNAPTRIVKRNEPLKNVTNGTTLFTSTPVLPRQKELASKPRGDCDRKEVVWNNMDEMEMADIRLRLAYDSLELNMDIANALDLGERPNHDASVDLSLNSPNRSVDEIPSSQKPTHVKGGAMTANAKSRRGLRFQSCDAGQNVCRPDDGTTSLPLKPESIAMLQSEVMNMYASDASEILRCTNEENTITTTATTTTTTTTTTSTTSTSATNINTTTADNIVDFNCIKIIDVCANWKMFRAVFLQLLHAPRLSVSLGLQKTEPPPKALIGSKLLSINAAADARNDDSAGGIQFRIDESSCTYLAGIAFSLSDNVVFYFNMQDNETCKDLRKGLKSKCVSLLMTRAKTLLLYDAKEQLKILRKTLPKFDIVDVQLEDPKVANWLLQPDKNCNIVDMTRYFAPECGGLIELCGIGNGRGYGSIGLDKDSVVVAKVRSSIEACVTNQILKGQLKTLECIGGGHLLTFFKDIEMPMQISLYHMESFGFPANEHKLSDLAQLIGNTMKKVEAKIYHLHGTRFNLNSATTVAKILGLHRRDNGRVSTSKRVLEKVDSPIATLIMTYRKLNSTLTKTIQPLQGRVINNRIHCNSITFTATGRIAMSEPSLQNVAKNYKVVLGSEKIMIPCRDAFFSDNIQRCLISADFCQLEMRILAHLSQDKALVEVMNSDVDIFIAIAARWNHVTEAEITEELRNKAKEICYGIIYGMGIRSLSEVLKCTEQEARTVMTQFHATYPRIRPYTDEVTRFAQQNGYVKTLTGRRRYFNNINNTDGKQQNQTVRQALNSVIQGSAADVAKKAVLRMEKNITRFAQKLNITAKSVQLILHLHDELIYEVPEEKALKIAKILAISMEKCITLDVPLKVKLKTGKTWGGLKEVNP